MFKKKDEEQVEEEILSMVEEGQKSGFIQEDEVESPCARHPLI